MSHQPKNYLVVPFQVVTFSLCLTKAKHNVVQDKRLSKSSYCSHHLTYFSQFCFPDEKCVVTICKGGNFIGYNEIQANDKDKCAYSQDEGKIYKEMKDTNYMEFTQFKLL